MPDTTLTTFFFFGHPLNFDDGIWVTEHFSI